MSLGNFGDYYGGMEYTYHEVEAKVWSTIFEINGFIYKSLFVRFFLYFLWESLLSCLLTW